MGNLTAVFDRLRQPDYLVSSVPRLNGFASLPRDRFAFIGAITLKELFPPHDRESASYYNGLIIVCQDEVSRSI